MESGSVSALPTQPVPRNRRSRSAFKLKKCSECCSWKHAALCAIEVSVLLAVLLCYCIGKNIQNLSMPIKLGRFAQENNTIDSGELDIGQRAIQEVPPGVFWRSQLFIDHPQFLRFNISLQKDALIGIYGRKGLPPSHTQYDFVELLDGSRLIARQHHNLLESERAGQQTRSRSLHEAGFIQYLDSGIWHLAFYNDGKNAEQVPFNTIIIGKHKCVSESCHCFPGFLCLDCSRACPVLCSGNGQYSKGRCLCFSGWKGTECDVPATQCTDLQCGGRGICIMGSCACNSGYKGENCEEADCLDPACSSHGVCVHGRCHCNPEWCGSNCEMLKTMCPDQCSGHGMYLQESDTCTCDPNWTGVDCSNEICPVDCGSHGVCMGGTCHCEKGWTGPACNQRAYHPRCAEHGTCECSQRRNGKRSGRLAGL
uniref:Teneurin-3 n=1 Tax=Gopherus evgoodei TaxID=1825980 RepID=A0A8C4YUX6_9SAUR